MPQTELIVTQCTIYHCVIRKNIFSHEEREKIANLGIVQITANAESTLELQNIICKNRKSRSHEEIGSSFLLLQPRSTGISFLEEISQARMQIRKLENRGLVRNRNVLPGKLIPGGTEPAVSDENCQRQW